MRLRILFAMGLMGLPSGWSQMEWGEPGQDQSFFKGGGAKKATKQQAPAKQETKRSARVEHGEVGALDKLQQKLVIVRGDEGVGSGFLANYRGRTFVITNTHVLAPNSEISLHNLAGDKLPMPRTFFVSGDRDLAILPVEWEGEALLVADHLDQIRHEDPVVVTGNSQGASVATKLPGEILGLGPETIEIDARFVKGNSGSPIIHTISGKVIGVASYALVTSDPDSLERDSSFQEVRRFGYRLDGHENWQSTTLAALHRQYERYETYLDRTEVLTRVIVAMARERRVLVSYKDHPSVGPIITDFNDNFGWGHGRTPGNIDKLDRFKNALYRDLERDTKTSLREIELHFYKSKVEELSKYRQELIPLLETISFPRRGR